MPPGLPGACCGCLSRARGSWGRGGAGCICMHLRRSKWEQAPGRVELFSLWMGAVEMRVCGEGAANCLRGPLPLSVPIGHPPSPHLPTCTLRNAHRHKCPCLLPR